MLIGPRTLTADEAIERFAEINQIDPEAAAEQFEPGSPWPKYMMVGARIISATQLKGDRGAGIAVEAAWRKQHGLSTTKGPAAVDLERYLARTMGRQAGEGATVRMKGQVRAVVDSFGFTHTRGVLDHTRYFGYRGRFAGFLSAPYIYWYDDDLLRYVRGVRSLGLAVRVGYEEDAYYNHGTPPIVVWNPEVVNLPIIGKSVVSEIARFNGLSDHSELIMRAYHKCQDVPHSLYDAEQVEMDRLRELLLSGKSVDAVAYELGIGPRTCVSRARRLVEKGELPPTVVGYE